MLGNSNLNRALLAPRTLQEMSLGTEYAYQVPLRTREEIKTRVVVLCGSLYRKKSRISRRSGFVPLYHGC